MEETRNNVDEIRKYALRALDVIKDYTGYDDGGQSGFHVSLRRDMEKWLRPEGIWELRIVGTGEPPQDDLRDLFSPCSKENKVDTMMTICQDFDLERSPNAKVGYSMEIFRDMKSEDDTGWCFACSTKEIPPDVIHMRYVEINDTRDGGYKCIKTYLQLSDADDPFVVLTKFWDFVGEKLTSQYDEKFVSGFLHIIGRLKEMLLAGKTPEFVFTSRTTLETNGVDEEKQNWKLVMTRTLAEGVDAWFVRITPVEGGSNLGEPEVFAELSVKHRPDFFEVENIIRSVAVFTGRSSFCRALDLSVKAIVQALDEGSWPLEIKTLRKVQEKLKTAFAKGAKFEDMEVMQKD